MAGTSRTSRTSPAMTPFQLLPKTQFLATNRQGAKRLGAFSMLKAEGETLKISARSKPRLKASEAARRDHSILKASSKASGNPRIAGNGVVTPKPFVVMPAKAGIQRWRAPKIWRKRQRLWTPACAGATPSASHVQRLVEIRPLRIEPFDQVELPPALPFLELLFPRNGFVDVAVMLVPDKHSHGIL